MSYKVQLYQVRLFLMALARPPDMYDRAPEWDALARFATDRRPGATLGIVSGRRRQGKSFLLQSLCEATGGFYSDALEAEEPVALRRLGEQLTTFTGAPARLAFDSWTGAVDSLLDLGAEDRPVTVVLDEFPYLAQASPALPSLLQSALGPRTGRRLASRTRLILCGSALSFMGRLLSGDAPLRGRAGLDVVVQSFDYRQSADFWGLAHDPDLAFRVHSVVGGTPAYRREFVQDDTPSGPGDFGAWVVRAVLNPFVPLFREGRYLLAEEPNLRDRALYHSVLAVLADGHTSRGGIASRLERSSNELAHPLAVLEDTGFVTRSEDAFRKTRPVYRIAEPILRFYHAIMRPAWGELERPGRAGGVWARAQATFAAAVLGPHFEDVCRTWCARFADETTTGPGVREVRSGVLNDPKRRTTHEVDVVALGDRRDGRTRVLLFGEAKYGKVMGVGDLTRLEHVRNLLADRADVDAREARLACFSAAGFTDELRAADRAGRVLLVSLDRLYAGS